MGILNMLHFLFNNIVILQVCYNFTDSFFSLLSSVFYFRKMISCFFEMRTVNSKLFFQIRKYIINIQIVGIKLLFIQHLIFNPLLNLLKRFFNVYKFFFRLFSNVAYNIWLYALIIQVFQFKITFQKSQAGKILLKVFNWEKSLSHPR